MPRCTPRPELALRLKELPSRPGVYRFYDAVGAMIYVGKSICLRDRVRSYFSGKPATRKLRRLRREIASVDWIETASELEALLLESRQVKQHLPRYNTLLRLFRAAPYVRVDWRDPYPRLEITRHPAADGAEYLGPFGTRDALEAAVSVVSDSMQLRTCELPGTRLPGVRPCYRVEFGSCLAPCIGSTDSDQYHAVMRQAVDLFSGRADAPLRTLEAKMSDAAENLCFETAARLRDAIACVRAAGGRQQALQSAIRRLTLLAVCPAVREDQLSLFLFACGRLALQKEVPRRSLDTARARRRLAREVARLRAGQPPLPEGPLSATTLDEIQIVSAWMRRRNREGLHLDLSRAKDATATQAAIESWLAGDELRAWLEAGACAAKRAEPLPAPKLLRSAAAAPGGPES